MTESDFQSETSVAPETFPWPPREDDSALDALATTWKESVFQPASFFRRMPLEFDFGWVLLYYLIIGIVAGGISLFWDMTLGPSLAERLLPARVLPAAGNPAVDFLLSPIFLLLGLFIVAGIIHFFLLIMRGGKNQFGATLRVMCFSAGPQIFVVVPVLGGVVGGVWALVLTIIGLREAHDTSTGKAVAAVLLPTILLMMFALMLFALTALIGLGTATR